MILLSKKFQWFWASKIDGFGHQKLMVLGIKN
jgi:hypothetical protein